MSILLNKEQMAAVQTDSKQVLVLAPPGSGKTATITERAAYLIEEKQVSGYELLLLTFTRRASREMRERLQERVGNQAYKITISTFHAMALNLLNRFGEMIGFQKEYSTVYGNFEEQYLIKDVATEMGYYKNKRWKKIKKGEIDSIFADYYHRGIEPNPSTPGYDFFKAFVFRCRENNSFTYGSLLIGLRSLLPKMSKFLHWKHIITDESQDTDPLQWSIIRQIQELCGATLFCVSDTDQAIYGFRGADTGYLIRHQNEFDIHELKTNYRSDANIVHAANRLIEHNTDRLEKTMVPFEDAQSEILEISNVDSESLVNLIKSKIAVAPDSVTAVLGRVHGILQKLSQLLEEEDIEHTYVGKKTALTNSEDFRRFHAFFKLIVNPFDNFSFLLAHNFLGVSRETYGQIRVRASQEHKSHFQTWQELPEIFDFATAHDDHGWTLISTMAYVGLTIKERFAGCADDSTEEIESFIQAWIDDNPNGDIREYLEWLATFDITDEMTEEQPMLSLLTIHSCKGLEFPTIIIAGANEGLIPSHQAIKARDIEGERRLFYVGITRAEDRLIITTRPEQSEDKKGNVKLTPKSRFIKEMQAP